MPDNTNDRADSDSRTDDVFDVAEDSELAAAFAEDGADGDSQEPPRPDDGEAASGQARPGEGASSGSEDDSPTSLDLDARVQVDGEQLTLGQLIDRRVQNLSDERIKGFQSSFTRRNQELSEKLKALEGRRPVAGSPASGPVAGPREQALDHLIRSIQATPEGQKLVQQHAPAADAFFQQLQSTSNANGAAPDTPGASAPAVQRDPEEIEMLLQYKLSQLEQDHVEIPKSERAKVFETQMRLEQEIRDALPEDVRSRVKLPLQVGYNAYLVEKIVPKLRKAAEDRRKAKAEAGNRATGGPAGSTAAARIRRPGKTWNKMSGEERLESIEQEFLDAGKA